MRDVPKSNFSPLRSNLKDSIPKIDSRVDKSFSNSDSEEPDLNFDSDDDMRELLRLTESRGKEPNIYQLIDENKLEEIKSLIAKNGDVLNVKDQSKSFPIFYAIKNKKYDIALELIKSDERVLEQKDDAGFNPFFYAIFFENMDLVDHIMKTKPEIVDEKCKEDYLPIFYAIKKEKNACAVHIFNQNPQILQQKDSDGSSLLEYAIKCENLEMIKFFIEHDKESLKDTENHPIFFAIANNKPKALEEILKLCPESLEYENDLRLNPLFILIKNYIENEVQAEDLKSIKSSINVIYKKQFKTENNISEEELKSLIDYFEDYSPIMLGYSKINFGIYPQTRLKIYKNLFSEIGQEVAEDMDRNKKVLLDSIDKTFKHVNAFEPIEIDKENLFIYESDIKKHLSFFVFHVDKVTNKLTHISYCEGNYIKDSDRHEYEENYIRGVKKYKVNKDIEFSEEFVKNFLATNTKNKNISDFFKRLLNPDLLDKDGDSIVGPDVDYLIPTKMQSRGNCAYKSTKILWRYLASLQNPELNFYLQDERKLFLETDESKKPEDIESLVDERISFKEIKGDLVAKALKNLSELRKNLDYASDEKINPDLKIYLQNQIQKLFEDVEVLSEKKIVDSIFDEIADKKEPKIHERIRSLVSPKHSMAPIQDDEERVVKRPKLTEHTAS